VVWCGVRVCACVRVSACVHACVRAHSEWSTFVKALLQKIPVTSTLQACRDLSENFVWTVYICYCSLCSQQTCTIPSTLCVDCVYMLLFIMLPADLHYSVYTLCGLCIYVTVHYVPSRPALFRLHFVWTVYICYCSLCCQQTCTIPSTLCVDCVYMLLFIMLPADLHYSVYTLCGLCIYCMLLFIMLPADLHYSVYTLCGLCIYCMLLFIMLPADLHYSVYTLQRCYNETTVSF